MTSQMREEPFERELRNFLAWQADDIADAPSATEIARGISSRAGVRPFGMPVSPHLAWVLLAGLLMLGLLGSLVVGALLLRDAGPPPDLTRTYEAVFVRWHEKSAVTADLVVFAIDGTGHEREITRLAGASLAHHQGLFPPRGALSSTGLLVIPRNSGRFGLMHWEIHDILHPAADPIVVEGIEPYYDDLAYRDWYALFVPRSPLGRDSSNAFWGPREQLAIPWLQRSSNGKTNLYRLAFVDGRTGSKTIVEIPGGSVHPYWASDGSGVFIARSERSDDGTLADQVLRPDGAVVEASVEDQVSTCIRRFASGVPIPVPAPSPGLPSNLVCLAPDESSYVLVLSSLAPNESGYVLLSQLFVAGRDQPFVIDGNFAGWLAINR